MKKIVVELGGHVKVRLRRLRRETRDAGLATRCQIILHAGKGRASRRIAEALGCSRSCVSRVIERFTQEGETALFDRREDNGRQKLTEYYLDELYQLVGGGPTDYGYRRPTWTRELLVEVMEMRTGVRINVGTMSRALRKIGARRGRPRPRVECPWSRQAKSRRLRAIGRVVESASPREPVVYVDEVDIHLNPKIGLDWMNRGQQKEVMTPGKNEKRYLAGALDARTGVLTCVESCRKNSQLVVDPLAALAAAYPAARRIHVILDNYRIHSSQITQTGLAAYHGRIVFHPLPPYCPDHNKIERIWLDLHSEVTRNHQCETMEELMDNVRRFITGRNGRIQTRRLAKAA